MVSNKEESKRDDKVKGIKEQQEQHRHETAERSKSMESRTKEPTVSKSQIKPSPKQSSMQKKQQEPGKNDTTFLLEAGDAQQV